MSTQTQPRPTLVPPTERKTGRRRIYVILALCLLLIAGGWIYSLNARTVEVKAVSPVYADIETSISSTGVVVPVNDFQARANFSGIVEQIYVHVGQKVRAGQMLLRMKDQYAVSRLDTARAALKSAEVSLQNAEQNGSQDDRIGYREDLVKAQVERDAAASALQTLEELQKRGSVSDAEVLAGKQRLQLANATLQALQQRMSHRYSAADIQSLKDKVRADQDSIAAEQVSWANANVSTPIPGTVYIIPVSQYDFVPAGNELMHVANLSQLEVRAKFYEPDIGKLQVGQPVIVQWEGAPGKSWTGQVIARPMAVDRSGPLSTGLCIISLTSPVSDLPVDSSVSVLVQSQKHAHVLTIPREALHGSGPDAFVFRVVGNRIRKTHVTTGLFNAMSVEISSGLNEHDQVVLHAAGNESLADGRRVEVAQIR